MRLAMLVALVACTAFEKKPVDARKVAGDVLLAASGDAKALGKLMHGSVTNGLIAVCAMTRLEYPPRSGPKIELVPLMARRHERAP